MMCVNGLRVTTGETGLARRSSRLDFIAMSFC